MGVNFNFSSERHLQLTASKAEKKEDRSHSARLLFSPQPTAHWASKLSSYEGWHASEGPEFPAGHAGDWAREDIRLRSSEPVGAARLRKGPEESGGPRRTKAPAKTSTAHLWTRRAPPHGTRTRRHPAPAAPQRAPRAPCRRPRSSWPRGGAGQT